MTRRSLRRRVHKRLLRSRIAFFYHRFLKSGLTFDLGGQRYEYFHHWYNRTYANERSVEIPIARRFVSHATPPVLEVGNVLSHYFSVSHSIVDKYEVGESIINQDIVTFDPGHRFGTIVSVSTLEHVGWDEKPRDPGKIPRAIAKLEELLLPGGRLLCTMPIGYNPFLDAMIGGGLPEFETQRFLVRVGRDNRWREVERAEALAARFDSPHFYANALLIAEHRRSE